MSTMINRDRCFRKLRCKISQVFNSGSNSYADIVWCVNALGPTNAVNENIDGMAEMTQLYTNFCVMGVKQKITIYTSQVYVTPYADTPTSNIMVVTQPRWVWTFPSNDGATPRTRAQIQTDEQLRTNTLSWDCQNWKPKSKTMYMSMKKAYNLKDIMANVGYNSGATAFSGVTGTTMSSVVDPTKLWYSHLGCYDIFGNVLNNATGFLSDFTWYVLFFNRNVIAN